MKAPPAYSPHLIAALRKLAQQDKKKRENQKKSYFLIIEDSQPVGPIEGPELKNFLRDNNLPTHTKIRETYESHFIPLYEHPYFQRRKPQPINSKNTKKSQRDSHIYYLKDGHKTGPFSQQEVHQLLADKELLLTDMVSFNNGASWNRLFEFEEFDRRQFPQQDLPSTPLQEVFNNSNSEVGSELETLTNQKIEEEALARLAFIENVKSGKSTANVMDFKISSPQSEEKMSSPINQEAETTEFEQAPLSQTNRGYTWVYALTILICLGGTFFLFSSERSKKKITQKTKSKISTPKKKIAQKQAIKPTKIPIKSKRKFYRPQKKTPSRKTASFTETDSFRNRKAHRMKDNLLEDSNRLKEDSSYDDGTEPVQHDPIRQIVSKETLDPEEDYFEDEGPREGNAKREPAETSPDSPWSTEEENELQEDPEYEDQVKP